jgi:D-glycero-D-manno-heptose 1,7-bisphosphate phosphatase
MKKAVFIDKDGTLIPDIPYNTNPDLISLSENSIEGLRELKKQGYLLVVISNQSGVARGYFKEEALSGIEKKLSNLLNEAGASLDGFYYCPHHPAGNVAGFNIRCECRKPASGMILKAAEDLDVDLSQSWMVGDILNDIEAGKQAGCQAILIDNHNETEWYINEIRTPDYTVDTINQAVEIILKPIKAIKDHEYGVS